MSKSLLEDEKNAKQFEDTRCPVCMEHPHNAILLICSSHDKGCRPFMCDTSYRHSNCFDQFRKSFNEPPQPSVDAPDALSSTLPPPSTTTTTTAEQVGLRHVAEQQSHEAPAQDMAHQDLSKLICPLCRGSICGWTVVESVRSLMNAKSRSCSCETCDFSGTYKDLRKHARSVHPFARPTETDPERQRSWRRLERQRDFGDLLSTLQSTFGGDENSEETTLTIDDGGWLTVFFLVRFIRTGSPSSGRSRAHVSSREAVSRRRGSRTRLWGETLDGDEDEARDENGSESSDNSGRNGQNRRRVRRRLNDGMDEEGQI